MKTSQGMMSSGATNAYLMSLNYLEQIRHYGPANQRPCLMFNRECHKSSSDEASVYEVSFNYLEWIKSYGRDRQGLI